MPPNRILDYLMTIVILAAVFITFLPYETTVWFWMLFSLTVLALILLRQGAPELT